MEEGLADEKREGRGMECGDIEGVWGGRREVVWRRGQSRKKIMRCGEVNAPER